MKKFYLFALLFGLALIFGNSYSQTYRILTWNDLGMHCANKDFSEIAVLPPYNNLYAQAIRVGDSNNLPRLISTGYTVTYEVPGNTYSVGKTNFWTYVLQLFGVQLANNIGLTGKGLSGNMDLQTGYFNAVGIPITPYTDANLQTEDPFQLALVKLYDASKNLLASTKNVIPVSNEINCVSAGCHVSATDILLKHEGGDGGGGGFIDTKLTGPVLCANCHASNALGTKGNGEAPPLSQAIHTRHGSRTNDCYKCHPGPNTQCFRDVMFDRNLTCQTCHGSVSNVGNTVRNGRRPWLDEPKCGDKLCHGSLYSEQANTLFRQSKGHAGLYCSACHGSPHAIVPSTNDRDNLQNATLQGYAAPLKDCRVCHGSYPTDPGPHGIFAPPSKVDVVPPQVDWTMDANGNVTGTVTDKPDDATIRSNLALIVFHATNGSYNYTFNNADFTPGVSAGTTWTLTRIDNTKNAKAVISFKDKSRNITTVSISFPSTDVFYTDNLIDFGLKNPGEQDTRTTYVRHRSSSLTKVITNISLKSGTQGFSLDLKGKTLPYSILPNDSLGVAVIFKSSVAGQHRDTILVTDDLATTLSVPLYATVGQTGSPVILTTDVNFGPVNVNTSSTLQFSVYNSGNANLTLTGYTGPADQVFETNLPQKDNNDNFINPVIIPPTHTLNYSVTFTPTQSKNYTDNIVIKSDAQGTKNNVQLSGTGQPFNSVGAATDPAANELTVAPDPAAYEARLIFGKEFRFATVEITNETGVVVWRYVADLINPGFEIPVNTTNFAGGIYFVNVSGKAFKFQRKLTIIR